MNKKIIIGSMMVFTMLLLIPNIPAVYLNAIENEFEQEYEELSSTYFVDFNLPDKFPNLYRLVLAIVYFKFIRILILLTISTTPGDFPGDTHIVYPLIYARCLILGYTLNLWMGGWGAISDILGWDWDI